MLWHYLADDQYNQETIKNLYKDSKSFIKTGVEIMYHILFGTFQLMSIKFLYEIEHLMNDNKSNKMFILCGDEDTKAQGDSKAC
mgnify:CR=1 FL=1